MRRKIILGTIFSILFLDLFLTACNQQPFPINYHPSAKLDDSQATTAGVAAVVDANNQFATEYYSRIIKNDDGNIFFSPYSISTALAMTYEGAKGQTAEEIQKVFHFPEDTEIRRPASARIYNLINSEGKNYKLTTANALWAQNDYPFVDDYFTVVSTYYGGMVTNLDFKQETEKSRTTINNWMEDRTNDRIKDLIPRGILDSATRLVLTNAIYFKANWSRQFDAQNTRDGQFKLASGNNINVKMMHLTSRFNYGENNDLQILEMNYLGNNLSMLIILPKENNLNQIEPIFSKQSLIEWKDNMENKEVIVTLPKFTFGTKYFMSDDLEEMGMPTAFKYPEADFTGMSPTDELYIDEVIHQTFIEVAEYGTEAAAATAVVMRAGAMTPTEEPKRFTADHPFIFIIQQRETGNILFMGRVMDPTTK